MHKLIKKIWIVSFGLISLAPNAQDVSLALQQSAKPTPAQRTAAWNTVQENVSVSFASTATRYAQQLPPAITLQNTWQPTAWKGEKLHTQILAFAKTGIDKITVVATNLSNANGHRISSKNISAGFVQYVITDEFKAGCGYRKPADFDSSEVADIINTQLQSVPLQKNTTQPIWLSIQVPANAAAGTYKGTVTVMAGKKFQLQVAITVIDRILPAPKDWAFQLDFWQHPAAIARVHQLPVWSDEHFAAMRPYYTMLANAGQKIITASIVDEPWGHQTYDDYPGLVQWTKKQNGTWAFDYTLFDKYVNFVMSCGITERINCYSMVPWKIAFKYYDEALQKDAVFTEAIGTPAYNQFWATMLQDFTKHLKAKGWFNITTIAMDERPMPAMQSVITLLKTIDPQWKISLAGDYHPEIEKDIDDYCVASRWTFPDSVLQARKQQGKISTWYTCCTEKYPNQFTFSAPDESVWMGWYTAATGMDGFLRWAYNSWPKTPLHDSRFTAWPAGDTYQVYPGPLSSIRFEKIIEGIQDFEKIKILQAEFKSRNETTKLNKLQMALQNFRIEKLAATTATQMVNQVKPLLND